MNCNTKLTRKANAKTQPLLTEEQRAQIRQGMQAFEQAATPRKRVLHPDYLKRKRGLLAFLANNTASGEVSR